MGFFLGLQLSISLLLSNYKRNRILNFAFKCALLGWRNIIDLCLWVSHPVTLVTSLWNVNHCKFAGDFDGPGRGLPPRTFCGHLSGARTDVLQCDVLCI